jgi:DNA mismatch repair ATPase MutL
MLINLKKIFEFEIHEKSLVITAIPSCLTDRHIYHLLENIMKFDTNCSSGDLLSNFIHEYGCKNSIRTGDTLNTHEVYELINQLRNISNNMFCNHGRRIMICIKKTKLDKLFGRQSFSDLFE